MGRIAAVLALSVLLNALFAGGGPARANVSLEQALSALKAPSQITLPDGRTLAARLENGRVVYGYPKDVIGASPAQEFRDGQWRYLGYTYTKDPFSNPEFPPDALATRRADRKWVQKPWDPPLNLCSPNPDAVSDAAWDLILRGLREQARYREDPLPDYVLENLDQYAKVLCPPEAAQMPGGGWVTTGGAVRLWHAEGRWYETFFIDPLEFLPPPRPPEPPKPPKPPEPPPVARETPQIDMDFSNPPRNLAVVAVDVLDRDGNPAKEPFQEGVGSFYYVQVRAQSAFREAGKAVLRLYVLKDSGVQLLGENFVLFDAASEGNPSAAKGRWGWTPGASVRAFVGTVNYALDSCGSDGKCSGQGRTFITNSGKELEEETYDDNWLLRPVTVERPVVFYNVSRYDIVGGYNPKVKVPGYYYWEEIEFEPWKGKPRIHAELVR